MAHHLAHENNNYGEFRDVRYTYDELNRLINVNDSKQDVFDEIFAYDAQGRITAQRRAGNVVNPTGGEYSYYSGKNRLKSVADNMGGTADERNMSDTANFVYDSVGNLTYDKSKGMEILYDWRGMPIEFIQTQQPTGSSSDTARLSMMYDGSGRRISKTVMRKVAGAADWDTAQVTHYTGIGTEIRENYAGPAKQTKVVVKSLQGECRKNKLACSYDRAAAADAGGVNMPQGLGRYGIEDAENPDMGFGVGYIPNTKFEWYLKNHLGSTMLVYGTQADANPAHSDIGTPLAAYDYRAFGEMVELTPPPTGKVSENFTGKELDDETQFTYHGARYLDPMLGMWISVDPARQFASPYLYAGNGVNPVNGVDGDGNFFKDEYGRTNQDYDYVIPDFQGNVTAEEMDAIIDAHKDLQSNFGLLDELLPSYAFQSYWNNKEIAFDLKTATKFTMGEENYEVPTVGPGFDKNVFHLHTFRYNGSKEGFSPTDNGMCNQYVRTDYMMEITSGNVYFQNAKVNNIRYRGVKGNYIDASVPFLLLNIPLTSPLLNYTPNRK